MARTRRTAGAGGRRSESAEGTRARHGEERHEAPHRSQYDHSQRSAHATQSEPAASADLEQLQEVASDLAPQLGAAAVAAIATAVVLPELLPAVLIGAGATLAPRLLPGAGYALRPIMKTVIRAGYAAFSTVQHLAAEAGEQMQDVIAEVQSEHRTRGSHRSHGASSSPGTEAGAVTPH